MNKIEFLPIGVIHSPFQNTTGTPIQAVAAAEVNGSIEVFPEYVDGLKDLGGFSHLMLFYHLHLVKTKALIVTPFLDNDSHGCFATRSPSRPNSIGFSVVKLVAVTGNILQIQGVDIINDTPLLDIKPYIPDFDSFTNCDIGWFEKNRHKLHQVKDDGRFSSL